MATDIKKITELDFDTIKQNLKDYFNRPGSPFRDWDFEGSGLSYLLDVLAYNTHYNAVNAHLSMNESFLDSAQIRANVVSRAKAIGYTPRSRRGSRAVVKLTFSRPEGVTDESLILPRGTKFATSLDGEQYIFSTREDYETTYNAIEEAFIFDAVTIVQGDIKTRNYLVNSAVQNQRFKIDDINIDTSTMEVTVKTHQNSSEERTFLNSELFTTYDSSTLAYFLTENYEGFYQIEFGNDLIGKKLDNLNLVTVTFLSSAGKLANGAKQFNFISTPSNIFDSTATLNSLQLVESAYGGDERESSESVRQIAPNSFIAQNRTVTVNDFSALIRKNIPSIEAISIWGGQDNVPPVYGHVFISAKPKDTFYLTAEQKNEILNFLDTVKIVTIKPQIVDADYIYLYFDIFFKYNVKATSLSRTQLESNVRVALSNYSATSLSGFEKVFRYSNLLKTIDAADTAILNSYARTYVYKTLNLYSINALPTTLDFKMKIYGEVNQTEPMIMSTGWKFNNQTLYLADEPINGSSTERNVYAYTLAKNLKDKIKVFTSLGKLNVNTGLLTLSIIPTTLDSIIQVKTIPDSFDIATIRNQLISIDVNQTSITGDIDDSLNVGAVDRNYDLVSRFRKNTKLR